MTRTKSVAEGRDRSVRLDNAPLDYAPESELGVVYLFSYLARKRFGLRVEKVQAAFPDCLAYRVSDGKRIRIEFEYRSRNFPVHRHDASRCDWIVCWIHDWPGMPAHLRVVELRKEFGLGFNIWFQPVAGAYKDILAKTRFDESWSVPSQASEGDLVLYYRTGPDGFVQDIFRVAGPVRHVTAGWKPGKDYMAAIRRVCTLKAPLHLSEMKDHPVVRSAGFVRGNMRGRYKASDYWPDLYRMIVARNPSVRTLLAKYGPDRI